MRRQNPDLRDLYIRVCRDSGFRMEASRAAILAASILGLSGIEVWLDLGLDNMERIANGTHPALSDAPVQRSPQ